MTFLVKTYRELHVNNSTRDKRTVFPWSIQKYPEVSRSIAKQKIQNDIIQVYAMKIMPYTVADECTDSKYSEWVCVRLVITKEPIHKGVPC